MKIGKFKKILVAGLVCALSFGLVTSTKMVNAEDNGSSETIERIDAEGLVTNKTVEFDASKNKYKTTLDIYNTGYKEHSKEVVPTDIVLVIDQSSSMEEELETIETKYYKSYTGRFMSAYNETNLYHKCENTDEYNDVIKTRSKIGSNWFGDLYEYKISCKNCDFFVSYNEKEQDDNRNFIKANNNLYTLETKNESVSKLEGLKSAVSSFVDEVAKNAQENKVQHRIAMVGFATGDESKNDDYPEYENTEGFIGDTSYNYRSSSINNFYKNAFQDMSTEVGKNNINHSINQLAARGATNVDLGMEMAKNVINQNPPAENEKRNQVVILFSDGEPSKWSDYSSTVANTSLKTSKALKDDGVSIYTIGVFNGAKPDDLSKRNNKFLNYTSNNYPEAKNMDGSYDRVEDGNYYLVADDSESLKNVFEQINNDITHSEITLDKDTIVKDIMSDYFKVDTEEPIAVSEIKCIGYNNETKEYIFEETGKDITRNVSIDRDSNIIQVNGYEFDKNLVMKDSSTESGVVGNKLRIEFYSNPINGFIGGNEVPTNDPNSGVYDKNGTLLEHFVRPTTDVALNYHFETNDTGIYITDDWKDFEFLVDEFNYKITNNSETEYSLSDDLVNDFVDVVYTVKDGEETIGTLTVPAGTDDLKNCNWTPKDGFTTAELLDEDEKEYAIEVSVIPTKDKSIPNLPSDNVQNDPNDDKSAKLYIFKPTVESHDIKNDVLLGSTVSNLDNQITDTGTWTCNTKDPNINTNIIHKNSIRPELTFKVTPRDQETVNKYTPTKIGYQEMEYTVHGHNGIDITTNTTVIHDNILKQCPLEEENKCSEKHFYMNVVGGTITIDKILDLSNGNLQVDESDGTPIFTFKIDKVNGNDVLKSYYKTVELSKVGNEWKLTEPVQITGLDVGTYKVTELSSMRYKFESVEVDDTNYDTDGQKVSLDSSKKNATYEYTNKVKSTEYDSDNGYLVNKVVKNEDGSYSMVASENSEK